MDDRSAARAAWHALDEPQALFLLGVDRSGLSAAEAARRLAGAVTADARALLEAGALCNDAAGAGEHATVSGEPTDAALAAAALAAGVDVEHTRRVRPRLAVIPFDSQRGWMAAEKAWRRRRHEAAPNPMAAMNAASA